MLKRLLLCSILSLLWHQSSPSTHLWTMTTSCWTPKPRVSFTNGVLNSGYSLIKESTGISHLALKSPFPSIRCGWNVADACQPPLPPGLADSPSLSLLIHNKLSLLHFWMLLSLLYLCIWKMMPLFLRRGLCLPPAFLQIAFLFSLTLVLKQNVMR
jgi:hypothetical protein